MRFRLADLLWLITVVALLSCLATQNRYMAAERKKLEGDAQTYHQFYLTFYASSDYWKREYDDLFDRWANASGWTTNERAIYRAPQPPTAQRMPRK